MSRWQYTHGLHDIGQGVYAYLQPDGGFGWSNAGLIADGGESLLVDTLYDEKLTEQMLRTMRAAERAANSIGVVVNTHANGDHTYGNGVVPGARVMASQAAIEEMRHINPERSLTFLGQLSSEPEIGEYFRSRLAPFELRGIRYTPATEGFSGETELRVGDKRVQLIEVGPAHTRGDILIYVPENRTVFTGDILFIDCTPIMWAGPASSWARACDRILALDVETIVPGHGPITDKAGVARMRDYLSFVEREARARFAAGLSLEDAIGDISLGKYDGWGEPERLVFNVAVEYRELGAKVPDMLDLFRMMGRYALRRADRLRSSGGHAHPSHN